MKFGKSMSKSSVLCGIKLPSITLRELNDKVANLERTAKTNLYFFYSEFIIRANVNKDYANVLNKAALKAIDGKGLEWANYNLREESYSMRPSRFLYPRFLYRLFYNLAEGFIIIFFGIDTTKITQNEVILGRDFIYTLLDSANKLSQKVFLVGTNNMVLSGLQAKYPKIGFQALIADANSDLMQDKGKITGELSTIVQKHSFLNENNLLQEFPDLENAAYQIASFNPDLVLVCLGGASGKQEFFLELIQSDNRCSYRLAVGVGAALDHMGGGQAQKRTNKFFEKRGLEWLFRIFTNPSRAFRTWYSIYMLWWLVSLQPFVGEGKSVNLRNIG